MRPVTATAAAVTSILGVGAAAVAAGRYASDVALKATPGRPLPADRRLTVHATAAGQVTLTRSLSALRPGTWGIAGSGVHAVVGPVVDGASEGADTVVRRLESVGQGILEPGVKVRLTPALYGGDPGSDLGLDHQEVEIPGELGPLPAWYVPGARDTWIITVHGLGTTRAQPMNLMPFLHQQRFPVLDLAYRGDPGAPRPADGLGHFGASEWRDLDAALRYALRYGARNVIVHGWSTGATMALHAAVESPLRDRISGIVLDSPVLDWQATVRALAAARGVPAALLLSLIHISDGAR
ncbi:alpha/beta hydrolase family protein, partial [Streptomyces sp. f51]|uniref:alpha/beta hydrolase family protein n=1 Tax=Streptomyces sp. f51 TaxID=1827742 RepID=UPI000BF1B9EA